MFFKKKNKLEEFLKGYGYVINVKEYIQLCNKFPEIRGLKYDSESQLFTVITDNGYVVKFKINTDNNN